MTKLFENLSFKDTGGVPDIRCIHKRRDIHSVHRQDDNHRAKRQGDLNSSRDFCHVASELMFPASFVFEGLTQNSYDSESVLQVQNSFLRLMKSRRFQA